MSKTASHMLARTYHNFHPVCFLRNRKNGTGGRESEPLFSQNDHSCMRPPVAGYWHKMTVLRQQWLMPNGRLLQSARRRWQRPSRIRAHLPSSSWSWSFTCPNRVCLAPLAIEGGLVSSSVSGWQAWFKGIHNLGLSQAKAGQQVCVYGVTNWCNAFNTQRKGWKRRVLKQCCPF